MPTLAIGTMRRGSIDRLLGLIIEPYHLGVQTASQVYRYLKGVPIQHIPFEAPIFHELQINTNEAARLGISIPSDFYGYATLIN